MNIPFSIAPTTWQRLQTGPLGPYLDRFAQHLSSQGYADATGRDKLRVVAKLSQWLERQQLGLDELDEQQVTRFHQHSPWRRRRFRRGDATTLQDLLEHLRACGVLPKPVPSCDQSPLKHLIDDFSHYLTEERGLAGATVDNYVPIARSFLATCFSEGILELGRLDIRDITRFILVQLRTLSPKRAQLSVSALRCFLRFVYQRGELTTDLSSAVPAVANWRLSEVPKFIAPRQVEQLLHSCNLGHSTEQRDYTVLLLLARLGLRAGEVVHLCLEDIDWHTGLLHVRGKGGRADTLPLPVDVGEALAIYLRNGRPRCRTRRVFVRARAPYTGFASSVAIDSILRRALRRAGLEPPRKGAHLLRHSLATEMLRNGASMAEIGQLLRHHLPQTTEIYAKVDSRALGALAQPWPGESP